MSKYTAEGSPLDLGVKLIQERDLIQLHEPVIARLGDLVSETGLPSLTADTKVRVQRFETTTHNVYSASFPGLHLLGEEVIDFCHQARGDFRSRDEYYPYRQTVRGIVSHWELFEREPTDGSLYLLHEKLVGQDHLAVFMDKELPLLHEAVDASDRYYALMNGVDRVISREFAKRNLLAVTNHLGQSFQWYYTKLGGILYGISKYICKPESARLQEAIASIAQQFPTIDEDDHLWRVARSDSHEPEKRMAKFARQTIEYIASDPQLVEGLFNETDPYNNGIFFTSSEEIHRVDEARQPHEIEKEEFWHEGMRYLGNGMVAVEYKGSTALVRLNGMDNIVVAENVREPLGISPWLLWAEDKQTGEMSLILGDVPSEIREGINTRASRVLGTLLAAVTLPEATRMEAVPPEVANRETEDFFVPLIAQTHALQIIHQSPFAQAVKALALSAA